MHWVPISLQFPQSPSPRGLLIFLPTTSAPSHLQSHTETLLHAFLLPVSLPLIPQYPPPLQGAPITCSLMNAFNQVYEVSLLSVTLIVLNCGIISSATLRRSSEAEQRVTTAGKMARVYQSLGGRKCQKKRQGRREGRYWSCAEQPAAGQRGGKRGH